MLIITPDVAYLKGIVDSNTYINFMLFCLQIIRGGFSLMLRHRLHCKIERAETETYLTGAQPFHFISIFFHLIINIF